MQQVRVTRWADGSVQVDYTGATTEDAKSLLYSVVLAMQEEDHAAEVAEKEARDRRNTQRRERAAARREAVKAGAK